MAGIDGHRVAERRRALGMDQDGLAAKSGVSQATISRIERGSSSGAIQTAEALARALSTSVAYLTGAAADPGQVPENERVDERDEPNTLEEALGFAFVAGVHTLRDMRAVEDALRGFRGLRNGDDVVAAAREWLDAAAALRVDGVPVTAQSLLVQVTTRRGPAAGARTESLNDRGDAELGQLGVKPADSPVKTAVYTKT